MSLGYKSSQKVSKTIHTCIQCDYTTSKISNYNKHLLTAKHIKVTDDDIVVAKCSRTKNVCICGKEYKHRQGLNRHKKECTYESIQPSVENPVMDTTMILNIMKENQEFKTLLFEQSKQVMELQAQQSKQVMELQTKQSEMFFEFQKENNNLINKLIEREPANNTNNTINGNVTNNNNKFNLNFFLNETCKDAMSIQEFMENIRITFQDLLKIGDEGFVNGVSDIFIKQLQNLDVSKRPIHCTDSKRETIYFKEDVWNKDDKDKTRLKQIIEKIEYRNVAALRDWCNENPDSRVNNTPNNLLKDKIYLQTLQGDERTRDKIIKNISKEVMVEKE